MAIISEVIGSLKDLTAVAKDLDIHLGKGTSIAKISQQATMQFPIITTRGLDIETNTMVSKALERKYASFVQIVISLNPYLNLDKDDDISSYLKRIHQNNPKMVDLSELNESCLNVYNDEAIGLSVLFAVSEGASGEILGSNKKQLHCVIDSLNRMAVNDLYKPEGMSLAIAEATMNHYCKEHGILLEAEGVDGLNDNQGVIDKNKNKANAKASKIKSTRVDSDNHSNESDAKREMDKAKLLHSIERDAAEYRSRAEVRLTDNDVKKSNELVPTTLTITLTTTKGDNAIGNRNFLLGVKGLLHPVNSNEMVSNLLAGVKGSNKFFDFLRWTTGEISFVKDLLLNVDGIKEDVIKKHSGNSHWWTTLKRRKTIARIKNIRAKNKILPNASIVCSAEEVSELKEAYGIDLMDIRHVKKIMDQYYLLGFVIVDSSQELCHFMFDGENNFQALSFKGLEKENNSKNDFKEIYKMINSGRL